MNAKKYNKIRISDRGNAKCNLTKQKNESTIYVSNISKSHKPIILPTDPIAFNVTIEVRVYLIVSVDFDYAFNCNECFLAPVVYYVKKYLFTDLTHISPMVHLFTILDGTVGVSFSAFLKSTKRAKRAYWRFYTLVYLLLSAAEKV